MKEFESLLMADTGLSPGEQQYFAQQRLPEIVSHSRLYYWRLGDPIINRGRRILLGVASYVVADLRLLDALNAILTERHRDRIDVFNILDVKEIKDFERYIPSIGKNFDVPLVAVWEDGILKEKAWGKAARDLLTRYFPSLSNVQFFDD